ncbi:MAG: GDP-mannose 4,6-dehydratase [Gammaproteobacteria bacterium]|nr:GDP-mannose 4,6-dehydratase [Gammaproteobacteria bacterium]
MNTGTSLPGPIRSAFRFHHVSTDEVYGELGPEDPPFREADAYRPNSPYAASKAAGDRLVRAWHRTYGLPVLIASSSNNYGPYQFPEKLIPLMILNAVEERELPRIRLPATTSATGSHVDDHARALHRFLTAGEPDRPIISSGNRFSYPAGQGGYAAWIHAMLKEAESSIPVYTGLTDIQADIDPDSLQVRSVSAGGTTYTADRIFWCAPLPALCKAVRWLQLPKGEPQWELPGSFTFS